jgi:polar amino acid transport system permease protein
MRPSSIKMARPGKAAPADNAVSGKGNKIRRARVSVRPGWTGDSLQRSIVRYAMLAAVIGAVIIATAIVRTYSTSSSNYSWDFGVVTQYLPALASGLRLTVELSVVSILLSIVLGGILAFGRMSHSRLIRVLCTAFIEVMRCTPLLVQLVWFFYALPILTEIRLTSFQAALLALTLHYGAYFGEAIRSGIQAVPKEHLEAAEVLGLTPRDKSRFVTMPQAFRIILPNLVSFSINLFKDTSLVAIIGLNDLTNAGNTAQLASYRPLEILTTVAVIYFIVSFPVTLLTRRLEIRLSRHLALDAR